MKILLVEDEERIAKSIVKGLKQDNFMVDLAMDGQLAMELAETNDYDVIILDLMLPKISGRELCSNLRKFLDTPILILTAMAEVTDKVELLNLGADDYLLKPFAFAELVARLRALARRPSKQQDLLLSALDLELDLVHKSVRRGQVSIDLSKKEFILLEYFLRHKNQVLSKEQILTHVWDSDTEVLFNTVEVYVAYLRNKIDKAFPNSKALLRTARGFGYVLKDQDV
jgi:DNA-binding response OmpR family regulator